MFGQKTFGRRAAPQFGAATAAASAPQPQRDPADEGRIIAAAMWDGPLGAKLREARMTPDSPHNLVLTHDRMRAMEDAATARMNRMIARIEAHVQGIAVRPFALIPWAVWEDANAAFLMKLDFLPSSPWNNFILPTDARSAEFLGLPEHPRAVAPGLTEQVAAMVTELREETADYLDAGIARIARGDFAFLDEYESNRNERFQRLFALARYLAEITFGPAVIAKHDEQFGLGLSSIPE
ncbi:hypothetical protein VCJ71_11985 [Alteriqipengyuania sp. WL0013]|uniref:hypothetical protein n=1 Tax=Alteriqipengyuania sp. WL0013 TaxID=3110773 RepID=UPI002C681C6D|nr:hypothetical protein [Alteriqipengyuania sp. WL0013]MEB3416788.1 hypothetical protein [Alteriqipengyuania sp. WL0013]